MGVAAMAVVFGTSIKGKVTVIYRNSEYVKERDNHFGTTSWRCQKYQSMQCKARSSSGNRIVSNSQPKRTYSGNVATTLARKAVGEMKTKLNEISCTILCVCANTNYNVNVNVNCQCQCQS